MRTELFKNRTIVAVAGLAIVGAGCGVKRGDLDGELATIRQEMESGDQALGSRVDGIDQRTNALSGQVSTLEGQVRGLQQELQTLRSEFNTRITEMEAAIRFDTPVHFPYDSDELRTEDRPVLERFASVVRQYYPNSTITVEGFTDPAGDENYNIDLGRRRADAVRRYLSETGGLDASRVRSVSYGEASNRQIEPGAWGDNGLMNRRVALVVDYIGGGGMSMTNN
jgi:peptidoglycan-associated lipoprotein